MKGHNIRGHDFGPWKITQDSRVKGKLWRTGWWKKEEWRQCELSSARQERAVSKDTAGAMTAIGCIIPTRGSNTVGDAGTSLWWLKEVNLEWRWAHSETNLQKEVSLTGNDSCECYCLWEYKVQMFILSPRWCQWLIKVSEKEGGRRGRGNATWYHNDRSWHSGLELEDGKVR